MSPDSFDRLFKIAIATIAIWAAVMFVSLFLVIGEVSEVGLKAVVERIWEGEKNPANP